jgi:hypothetical protein
MFGLHSPLTSDVPAVHPEPVPGANQLAREVAACHKRSNILLALTKQDLADAREWLDRCLAEDLRQGRDSSVRK